MPQGRLYDAAVRPAPPRPSWTGVSAAILLRGAVASAEAWICSAGSDLELPGYRLRRLRGDLAGYWGVSISGNWRIGFRFAEGDVFDVNLLDYHRRVE